MPIKKLQIKKPTSEDRTTLRLAFSHFHIISNTKHGKEYRIAGGCGKYSEIAHPPPMWSHPPCYDLILLAVISHLICHDLTPCYAPCCDLIHTASRMVIPVNQDPWPAEWEKVGVVRAEEVRLSNKKTVLELHSTCGLCHTKRWIFSNLSLWGRSCWKDPRK